MGVFLQTVAATMVSVVASWFFAWLYYRRAGTELREEARELRRITNLILTGLHHAHLIDVRWDERGRPTGINITITPQPAEARLSAPAATLAGTEPAGAEGGGPS